jgi:FHS family L-fucose permease-like MFS transporter
MQPPERGTTSAFLSVTTLFFAWGAITSLIDPLVAAVKGIFNLSDLMAQLSTSAFFIAYGLVSLPAAGLVRRLGPANAILSALAMMIIGCLTMLSAANMAIYALVLAGLFILASGITILQVSANPLAAALGAPERSHLRLTLSQAFNSFGTFLGPILGAHLFLNGLEVKQGATVTPEARADALAGIDTAYFWICGLIGLLLAYFLFRRRLIQQVLVSRATAANECVGGGGLLRDALSSPWTLVGGLAIFLYVGAEVAIGSQMALFLNSDAVWGRSDLPFTMPLIGAIMGDDGQAGVSLQEAGKAVALYWGGAMIGRLAGTALLMRISAARLLAFAAGIAMALCLYVAQIGGVSAGFAALSIGLFNSVMFPLIFTLILERSSASAEATSGFLCMAIVGGAAIPPLVGLVSGIHGYGPAMIVPAVCYALLLLFALVAGARPGQAAHRVSLAAGH